MNLVAQYIPFVEFLGQALGKNYEVVLHDLTTPDTSIVAIANGEISGRAIGGPVTDFVLKVLKQGKTEHKPFIANYHGKNINNHVCCSSSYFIHDQESKVVGVLCINRNITPYLEARKFLTEEVICDGPNATHIDFTANVQDSFNIFENFQGTVGDVIGTLLDSALQKYPSTPQRLALNERLAVVQELNDNGLFLLKGGITALAERLKISEPTVYRYLGKIKKDNEV
ncbi:MAG: PAS domain-containing protein [Acidaminococcaceae bacterium]